MGLPQDIAHWNNWTSKKQDEILDDVQSIVDTNDKLRAENVTLTIAVHIAQRECHRCESSEDGEECHNCFVYEMQEFLRKNLKGEVK